MKKITSILLYVFIAFFSLQTHADKTYQAYPFENSEDNVRFHELLTQLRCLVCQNQSLADSDATLAQDLRQKVYELLQAGDSDQEILSYLMLRYGDFILLEPQVTTKTYLLWSGPFILLLLAALLGIRVVYRNHKRYKADAS